MRLELRGRHLEIPPTLRRLVATKVAKLERVLNSSAVSAQVVLTREKHRHLTEITLHARGKKFLHAVGDAGNWEASLTEGVDELVHQAGKVKTRWQPWKRRRGGKDAALASVEQPAAANVSPAPRSASIRPRMPRTLRASRQAIKAMSVADAARAIDGNRDGIVVFLDTETAAINVLYRCHDGELALVEIEL